MKYECIGIIAAMKIEAEGLLSHMEGRQDETVGNVTYAAGSIGGQRVVVAVCGIGKVFAAICAQTMLLRYHPDCLINTGVAGTLTARLSVGQIAMATDVVQHDMDTSAIGDPVGLLSGINLVHIPTDAVLTAALTQAAQRAGATVLAGTIASGDQFIADGARKAWIASTFGAIACEMEGAAIGQVAYVGGVPFAVVRAISDGGGEDAQMDYPTFARMAAERSVAILLDFLRGANRGNA